MKGEVIEPENLDEAMQFFVQQPIGARLHVFSPELDDHVDEEGFYLGPSSEGTRYVGLRDVMVVTVKRTDGEQPFATVKIHYNKKDTFVKVALNAMFLQASPDESEVISPGPLLVDYFLPRLSIN
ncbi:unnamed protein product [Arabis nemorensis]|uniref:Uncharacterized protein n=1 Tax=Arabis nemorensis TaxID=586526 RepID=A0A565CB08_9BRAS|nr:unnamed protein product [Arabis nemorensis]